MLHVVIIHSRKTCPADAILFAVQAIAFLVLPLTPCSNFQNIHLLVFACCRWKRSTPSKKLCVSIEFKVFPQVVLGGETF